MKQKIIKTKQDYCWTFIHHYLNFLESFAHLHTDEEYKKLLRGLLNYVDKQIEVDGEIVDYHITVLYTPED